jgi:hypothetical protein
METLAKLFGSELKVKLIRLFIFNPEYVFDTADIADKVKVPIAKIRKEAAHLEKMGLVKKKSLGRKNRHGFSLDPQFSYLEQLRNFLINIEPLQPKELIRRLGKAGSMKLILTAGVFIQDPESRVDILIVGDGVKKGSLDNAVKGLEAEIGKELRYAYFSTEDFKYRLSMYDKLTRDILDYPHKMVLDKLGLLSA